MRLHKLEITAFGPFAETVRVDFDALSDAGLFLLTGPTGAGKSSVLDAVCFALYGDVPGDRGGAKRLRCDLAEEGAAPRVVLETTLAGRRFRIDRSPSWQRPKRRGSGLTTEQARVVVSERISTGGSAEWAPLATRLDESGHLLTRLIGMNLAQFCQVAMLPQGRFQTFLRASSQERHALLQRLFSTGRFDEVETWLRNRRVELRRAAATHQERVADQISRISEVATDEAPHDWESDTDKLNCWTVTLRTQFERDLLTAQESVEEAKVAEAEASSRHAAALELDRSITLIVTARAEASRLDQESATRLEHQVRLANARRAEAVQPLHERAVEALRALETATSVLEGANQNLRSTGAQPAGSADEVVALLQSAQLGAAEVRRVRPLQSRTEDLAKELAAHRLRRSSLEDDSQSLPKLLQDKRDQLAETARQAAALPGLRARLAGLQERHSAALRAVELSPAIADAETHRSTALAELNAAKQAWLDIRERRLDGMAAEIAAVSLGSGANCPVCGSTEHPSPALAAPDAPDVQAERSARRFVDDCEIVLEAHTQQVNELKSQFAAASALAGDKPEDLPALMVTVQSELAASSDQSKREGVLSTEVETLERQLAELAGRLPAVSEALADSNATGEALVREHELIEAQVQDVLASTSCDSLDQAEQHFQQLVTTYLATQTALTAHAQAVQTADFAHASAASAARSGGFASAEAAADACLGEDEVLALEAWVEAHDHARGQVDAILNDPVLACARGATRPELTRLATELTSTRALSVDAATRLDSLTRRCARLESLCRELSDALEVWAPARDDLDLTASLTAFVEGKSSDNRLQMRLSAYVLAHRLSQVVEAANIRLAEMSDRRFTLVHTGQRGAGEQRGGLSLLVRDDWSGETRDPATLSGGETFVVSLALALGLADVITAEAGGAELDTLFVDEGFGALDADTLDDVLDTLDALRDGGRVVGVVSHVLEMQTRIPTQLRVHKARRGSRLSQ